MIKRKLQIQLTCLLEHDKWIGLAAATDSHGNSGFISSLKLSGLGSRMEGISWEWSYSYFAVFFGLAISICRTQNWKLKSAKISSAFYRFSIARMQPEFNKISPDFLYISAFEIFFFWFLLEK
jgi:hypothetical protein